MNRTPPLRHPTPLPRRWWWLLALALALAASAATTPTAAASASAAAAAASGVSGLAGDGAEGSDGAPARPSVRSWQWPLPGRPPVLRRFDPPATPYGPGHRGVDLGGAPGDPVLAAGPGVVVHAGVLAGRGVVSVQHPSGLRTTYEPLAVAVRPGAAVTRGSVLGRLLGGHAACPWPACLHWGLRRGDTYLNPLSLLQAGPVRLLPLHDAPP